MVNNHDNTGLSLKDSMHGKGVFSGRKFAAGEVIMEFRADVCSYEEQDARWLDYYVQVGEDLFMGLSGGMDDYVNHSCDPNAALK